MFTDHFPSYAQIMKARSNPGFKMRQAWERKARAKFSRTIRKHMQDPTVYSPSKVWTSEQSYMADKLTQHYGTHTDVTIDDLPEHFLEEVSGNDQTLVQNTWAKMQTFPHCFEIAEARNALHTLHLDGTPRDTYLAPTTFSDLSHEDWTVPIDAMENFSTLGVIVPSIVEFLAHSFRQRLTPTKDCFLRHDVLRSRKMSLIMKTQRRRSPQPLPARTFIPYISESEYWSLFVLTREQDADTFQLRCYFAHGSKTEAFESTVRYLQHTFKIQSPIIEQSTDDTLGDGILFAFFFAAFLDEPLENAHTAASTCITQAQDLCENILREATTHNEPNINIIFARNQELRTAFYDLFPQSSQAFAQATRAYGTSGSGPFSRRLAQSHQSDASTHTGPFSKRLRDEQSNNTTEKKRTKPNIGQPSAVHSPLPPVQPTPLSPLHTTGRFSAMLATATKREFPEQNPENQQGGTTADTPQTLPLLTGRLKRFKNAQPTTTSSPVPHSHPIQTHTGSKSLSPCPEQEEQSQAYREEMNVSHDAMEAPTTESQTTALPPLPPPSAPPNDVSNAAQTPEQVSPTAEANSQRSSQTHPVDAEPSYDTMPTHAIVLYEKWLQLILQGTKTWEIRKQNTHKRERIALAASGTSKLFGDVHLIDCIQVTHEDFASHLDKHCVPDSDKESYIHPSKTIYAWHVTRPRIYSTPVPFKQKRGQIVWIDLTDQRHIFKNITVHESALTTTTPASRQPALASTPQSTSSGTETAQQKRDHVLFAAEKRRLAESQRGIGNVDTAQAMEECSRASTSTTGTSNFGQARAWKLRETLKRMRSTRDSAGITPPADTTRTPSTTDTTQPTSTLPTSTTEAADNAHTGQSAAASSSSTSPPIQSNSTDHRHVQTIPNSHLLEDITLTSPTLTRILGTPTPHTAAELRGLCNLGNTCYGNALISALSRLPRIRGWLAAHANEFNENKLHNRHYCAICHLARDFDEITSGTKTAPFRPTTMKNVNHWNPNFAPGRQQDAEEAFQTLFAACDACSVKELKLHMQTPSTHDLPRSVFDATPYYQICGGVYKDSIHCSTCDSTSQRFDLFTTLQLKLLPGNNTLAQLIASRLLPEPCDEDYRCSNDRCAATGTHTKQCQIARWPQVLVVHLMRWKFNTRTRTRTKIDDFV